MTSAGLAAIVLSASPAAYSESTDLGVIGRLYPIGEADLLEVIRTRLGALQRSGRLQALRSRAHRRARAGIARPPGIGLPGVTRPALREAALVPAKTPVMPASAWRLLFIDGDSRAQLLLAERWRQRGHGRLKLVLVSGAPLALRQRGLPAYFDQYGALSRRLGIRRVPSMVYLRDGRLWIEELVADEHE